MPERYDLVFPDDDEFLEWPQIGPTENGTYVLYSDYAGLKGLLKQMAEELRIYEGLTRTKSEALEKFNTL